MSVTFGPSTWWLRTKEAADYYARICPVGTILGDGSAVYCRGGGLAWIVAPCIVEVSNTPWAGGKYNNICVANAPSINICCICEWPSLCSALISNGNNPSDWFVPNWPLLLNAYNLGLYGCWGGLCNISIGAHYWSSSESNCIFGIGLRDSTCVVEIKSCTCVSNRFTTVRPIRCINV